jgi:hypothetical protein
MKSESDRLIEISRQAEEARINGISPGAIWSGKPYDLDEEQRDWENRMRLDAD